MGENQKERFRQMKKRLQPIISFGLLFILILGIPRLSSAQSNDKKQLAFKALQNKDYQQVVAICESELQKNPHDYDFNFLLARAEAYQGNWNKALKVTESLLKLYPHNLDLLLFRARLLGWQGDYQQAREKFHEILQVAPDNLSAWLGLVDLALWQHRIKEALNLCWRLQARFPEEHRIYFKLAQLYYHQGHLDQARQFIQQALNLNPGYKEYQQFLALTAAGLPLEHELRYSLEIIAFNDQRTPYQTHQFTLELGLPRKKGAFLLTGQETRRFKRNDTSLGVDLYYVLRPGTYTHLDFQLGSPGVHFPRSTYHAEIYQSILHQGEISLGFRRYNFKDDSSLVLTGSAGVYWGRFFSFLRWFFNQEKEGPQWAWFTQTRMYFASKNFLFLGLGGGARPFKATTLEDWLAQKSTLFLGGLNWTLGQRLHLMAQFTFRQDKGGVTRYTFFTGVGYKF